MIVVSVADGGGDVSGDGDDDGGGEVDNGVGDDDGNGSVDNDSDDDDDDAGDEFVRTDVIQLPRYMIFHNSFKLFKVCNSKAQLTCTVEPGFTVLKTTKWCPNAFPLFSWIL